MTQAEIGKLFGVNPFTVCNWEKNNTVPLISHMPKLVEFLGYDPISSITNSVAEYLLFKRRVLGWSQKVAARNLGVDPCTWSSWECGGTIMTHGHRRLVASFLGISEEAIYETMKKQWNKRHGK